MHIQTACHLHRCSAFLLGYVSAFFASAEFEYFFVLQVLELALRSLPAISPVAMEEILDFGKVKTENWVDQHHQILCHQNSDLLKSSLFQAEYHSGSTRYF